MAYKIRAEIEVTLIVEGRDAVDAGAQADALLAALRPKTATEQWKVVEITPMEGEARDG